MLEDALSKLIYMAVRNVKTGNGGPFSCIIIDKDGNNIGMGCNEVTTRNDPTAHAEVIAIRNACNNVDHYRLPIGSVALCSCEPCPMCRGALMWAGVSKILYVATREDADMAGFKDKQFYEEWLNPVSTELIHQHHPYAIQPFEEWTSHPLLERY